MKAAHECKSLAEIREEIDRLDHQLVSLLAQRTAYVTQAAKFKKNIGAVQDPARVQQVIESKKVLARELGASPELVGNLYRSMIDFFIAEELKVWQKSKTESTGS